MPKRASAKEVAELAMVSRTTVSFVLNNAPGMRLSEEARQRVFKAVRRNLSRLHPILHSSLPTPNLVIPADDQVSLGQRNIWSDTPPMGGARSRLAARRRRAGFLQPTRGDVLVVSE